MDRGHPELAARIDALHPAVLRLIALAVRGRARTWQAGRRVRRPCVGSGRRADADRPGVHELSAVPAAIPQLKSAHAALRLDAAANAAHSRRATALER